MTRLSLTVVACLVLLVGAHELRAQSVSLPLSSFSAGFGEQTGTGRKVLAQVGNAAVGRSSGSGKVVLSGFLPGAVHLSGGAVGVEEPEPGIPEEFGLSQNYPNPFNPATKISFSLPKAGNVTLVVYDILGREVATIVNEFTTAGNHTIDFNASNLSSGVYLYKIQAGDFTETKKMMLIK
jgi:hypothetical protein